ncbi:MAG: MFS transporter [Acidobacteriota bacterium]|nr:MFS transporter [Acidobacteriota bacterium]
MSTTPPLRRKLPWVALLYFAEGFPFGFVNEVIPVALRRAGFRLETIGLFHLTGLAWTYKFAWAPLVDLWGRRKYWIVGCQVLLAVLFGLFPWSGLTEAHWALWATVIGLTVLSATQDIAIDAYSIQLLEAREMGLANGVRVTAYRVALIVAGGALVVLAGRWGWSVTSQVAAGLFVLLALLTLRAPNPFASRGEDAGDRPSARALLKGFFQRPGWYNVVAFIFLFKLGDQAMSPMKRPFLVDAGLTLAEIGFLQGTLGMLMTVAGALVGGWLTSRWGIFAGLWQLGLLQALSNLLYAYAAWDRTRAWVGTAIVVEEFTGGMGTAAFLAFLMAVCDKRYAATQYALLSALFGLPRTLVSALSGVGAAHLGYSPYFAVTFILALPAFALLPFVRPWVTGPQVPGATSR